MGNFFNIDNGFFAFLSKVCDILFLSIIWVAFCIPIITIGPANTALYYATVKVIRRDRGYLFREFFKSFRMNFKRAA
ncbi:MAG: YesL family protein, partial [Herbinix sp.]|nr:YesL family protein [Herbinix sp.]